MEFIHRILSFGITEDKEVLIANRIKAHNGLYIVMVLALIISLIISSAVGLPVLQVINLIFITLYILIYLVVPPYRNLNLGAYLSLSICGLMLLTTFVFVPELSPNIILAFFLLFPIIAATILAQHSLWISIGMGIGIIALNSIEITDTFLPLPTISLAIFILVYTTMITVSYLIEKSQSSLIRNQARTVTYFESEIRLKDEFISQLSHKLRTSLSNITLINSLVRDSKMSSTQKELLDTLETTTFNLIDDVNDLVEISTPAIIDFKQSILSFSLAEVMHGTMAILKSDEDFNVEVQVKGEESLGYNLIGDPSLVRSILINLIKGIDEFKFTNDPVVLSVMIDYESQNLYGLKFSLEFYVEDQPGLRKLLQNINKASEQRNSKLINTNHLLALTASHLEFTFEGERLVIYFFQDISKDPTRKISSTAITKAETTVPKAGKKSLNQASLLLVEDNAINQKIVLLSLNNQVQQIDVANNGKEALDMFGKKKYDVILMDIQMPLMDGITATKKIREIESTSKERVPIIAITANALAGDRDNCMAAGADDYISKPFLVDELVKKITALLIN